VLLKKLQNDSSVMRVPGSERDATCKPIRKVPNKITGANSRPALQFERRGFRRCVLVVATHARYHGGAAVAQFCRWTT
jgi:hypothetical protein